MSGFFSRFFKGNPFGSVTLASVVTVLVAYLTTHFDPSKLTPTGLAVWTVVSTVIGVLTHTGTTKAGGSGTGAP